MTKAFKHIIVLFYLSFSFINSGNAIELSKQAYASLLTCSSGDEMYAAFGHTALRINDSINGFDIVYNYGTFDFNTPNFYTKFAKGTLLYLLNDEPFYAFERDYEYENRWVREQIFNLSHEQLLLLYNLLEENLKPENKSYQYDIFYDNCSTRVRDIIEKVLGGNVNYIETNKKTSFRELLFPFIENKPWIRFGIDLLLGKPIDKITTTRESCFLPKHLYDAVAIMDNPVTGKPLVISDKEVVSKHTFSENKHIFLTPVVFFWILLIVVLLISFIGYLKKYHTFLFDKIFFSIVGCYGLLILFMMFWSEHASVSPNLNILWSLPFCLPIYFITSKKMIRKWESRYYFILTIIIALFLISYPFLPQKFHPAVIPLSLILLIRCLKTFLLPSKLA